jgi:kelch-like protein 20
MNSAGGSCNYRNGTVLNTMDVIRDCSATTPPTNRQKLTKISERHPRQILEQINSLRHSKEGLCDVYIKVGQCRIAAHKIILSASSPYFRAMFTSELAESKQTQVELKDIDESAMEMLIDFCYTSQITVDEKTVQSILPAACLLQVKNKF